MPLNGKQQQQQQQQKAGMFTVQKYPHDHKSLVCSHRPQPDQHAAAEEHGSVTWLWCKKPRRQLDDISGVYRKAQRYDELSSVKIRNHGRLPRPRGPNRGQSVWEICSRLNNKWTTKEEWKTNPLISNKTEQIWVQCVGIRRPAVWASSILMLCCWNGNNSSKRTFHLFSLHVTLAGTHLLEKTARICKELKNLSVFFLHFCKSRICKHDLFLKPNRGFCAASLTRASAKCYHSVKLKS